MPPSALITCKNRWRIKSGALSVLWQAHTGCLDGLTPGLTIEMWLFLSDWISWSECRMLSDKSGSGTNLSDKAGLSFPAAGWKEPGRCRACQNPPAELHCSTLFPHLSNCIKAWSQLNIYTGQKRNAGWPIAGLVVHCLTLSIVKIWNL